MSEETEKKFPIGLLLITLVLGVGIGVYWSRNRPSRMARSTKEMSSVKIIKGKPARFYSSLADTYREFKEYDPAIELYRHALLIVKSKSHQSMILVKLGVSEMRMGAKAKGAGRFGTAFELTRLEPQSKAKMYRLIVAACEDTGELKRGEEYAQAWMHMPGCNDASRNEALAALARLKRAGGQLRDYIKEMEARVAKDPKDKEAGYILQYIYSTLEPNSEKLEELKNRLGDE